MHAPEIVTNLPEQGRAFYAGVIATVAILAILAREIPALVKFLRGRRNGHHQDPDPDRSLADQIRAQAKAEALEEAREQTKVTLLTARMDAAWAYLDDIKGWRMNLAERLGQLPSRAEIMSLGDKIEELREHTDALASAARLEIVEHERRFHPIKN